MAVLNFEFLILNCECGGANGWNRRTFRSESAWGSRPRERESSGGIVRRLCETGAGPGDEEAGGRVVRSLIREVVGRGSGFLRMTKAGLGPDPECRPPNADP
jgi:hypothetical protein